MMASRDCSAICRSDCAAIAGSNWAIVAPAWATGRVARSAAARCAPQRPNTAAAAVASSIPSASAASSCAICSNRRATSSGCCAQYASDSPRSKSTLLSLCQQYRWLFAELTGGNQHPTLGGLDHYRRLRDLNDATGHCPNLHGVTDAVGLHHIVGSNVIAAHRGQPPAQRPALRRRAGRPRSR